MSQCDWLALLDRLRGIPYRVGLVTRDSPIHHVAFQRGLSNSEVNSIQDEFGFHFPPDLRAFLQVALPHGAGFPDWRTGDRESLRARIDAPEDDLLFAVGHGELWLDEWGPRPSPTAEAIARAREILHTVPRLIPVFAHRMIPDDPNESGNPVFSVHQTDIIHYGFDLTNYLEAEFHLEPSGTRVQTPREIRFWSLLVS
jgi:hypothetical protein